VTFKLNKRKSSRNVVGFLMIISFLALSRESKSQSLTGTTGLLLIPTADMQKDGTFILGTSYFNKQYLAYGDYQYNAMAGYVNLTFLPFVELSFRYTYRFEEISRETRYFPDRMPSVRLRIIKERKNWPAIVAGVHDFTSTQGGGHFSAKYLVATKTISGPSKNIIIKGTFGYGIDYRKIKILNSRNGGFEGPFGGIQIEHSKIENLSFMFEYDSQYWNSGARFILFKKIQFISLLRNMKTWEGSLTYKIHLD
jgi:hypothetical protein